MGSGVVVWLTRQAGQEGDPSLRLKNGFVQDDAEQTFEVWTQPALTQHCSRDWNGKVTTRHEFVLTCREARL